MDIPSFLNKSLYIEEYCPEVKIVAFIDIDGNGIYDWVQIKNKFTFQSEQSALYCIKKHAEHALSLYYHFHDVKKTIKEIESEVDDMINEYHDRFKFKTINIKEKDEKDIHNELVIMCKKINKSY